MKNVSLEDLAEELDSWNSNMEYGGDVYVFVWDDGEEWAVLDDAPEKHQEKFGGDYAIVSLPGYSEYFDGERTALKIFKGLGLQVINPTGLTKKGERMYGHIKTGYGRDPRAKEIAARTVYARSAEGVRGLRKKLH